VTLMGWSSPRSPTGKASLISKPPWHFSGDVTIVDFNCPPERAAEMFPQGMEPAGDGSASVVFGAWAASADHDMRLLQDPGRGQYQEAYIVFYGTFRGRQAGRVAYIWVDNDISLVRGLVQGFPKKAGSVELSRAVAVGRGGPQRAENHTFYGQVSSGGERIIEASVTLESMTRETPSAVSTPLVHARWWPSLSHAEPEIDDFAQNRVTDFAVANGYRGSATLSLRSARFEEVDRLLPVEVSGGWVASVGFTLIGGTTTPRE
jgi:acetoacetate decarboxylase